MRSTPDILNLDVPGKKIRSVRLEYSSVLDGVKILELKKQRVDGYIKLLYLPQAQYLLFYVPQYGSCRTSCLVTEQGLITCNLSMIL